MTWLLIIPGVSAVFLLLFVLAMIVALVPYRERRVRSWFRRLVRRRP